MTAAMTSSRVETLIRRLCRDAVLTAAALILSYLESILPLSLLIPLPGVKLGLANVAVTFAFFAVSPADAAGISLVRVILISLLFGSPVSFAFSISGATLAYAGLWVAYPAMKKRKMSFVGCSALCACLNGLGQIFAATVIYTPAAFSYFPVLLAAGCVLGGLNGLILNIIYPRLGRITKNV